MSGSLSMRCLLEVLYLLIHLGKQIKYRMVNYIINWVKKAHESVRNSFDTLALKL